jgi:hypothetical protein
MSSPRFTAVPPPAYDEDAPRPRSFAPRVWAGAVLVVSALALVLLAGCFLIGALIIADPGFFNAPQSGPPPSWDPANVFLFVVLDALALACFLAAAVLGFLGVLGLYRVLFREAPTGG